MTIEEAKELDQFYTNPLVAKRFVEEIDNVFGFDNYDYIIEPSMGEGFIYDYLPKNKRIGLDIQKNHPDCLEGDFLKWNPDKSGIEYNPLLMQTPKILFIGNPPFGRSSSLALKFFYRCAMFSDTICFIIPRTWMFSTIQNRIPNDFKLLYNAILPDESFIHNDEPYIVKCCAQMWSRVDPKPNEDIDNDVDWRDMVLFEGEQQIKIEEFRRETEEFFQSGKRDE